MKSDRQPGKIGTDAEAFWEQHYACMTGKTSGRPSAALVRFVEGRAPGRALDLGCARGDDVIWLARQGWVALGVDVAEAALRAARENAEAAGVGSSARFEQHDLSVSFPEGTFDLITAFFFHSPVDLPRDRVLHRAAQSVAKGGLLLSVTHASVAPWSWSDPDTVFATPQEELAAIDLDLSQWRQVEVSAPERLATGPRGETAVVTDNIIAMERM
ncbi:MAG: methyltransferase domain-containing protein [Pseudomonadota bacterium]